MVWLVSQYRCSDGQRLWGPHHAASFEEVLLAIRALDKAGRDGRLLFFETPPEATAEQIERLRKDGQVNGQSSST